MAVGLLRQSEGLPRVSNVGFRIVRLVLGMLLLVAAGMKAHGLAVDPFSQDSFLGSPRLEIATIEVEIMLGLWLLSGLSSGAAWVAALVFYCTLASASLYLALAGQRSCACFGRFTVSPWLAFAIDVGAVAALAFWRPARAAELRPTVWLGELLKTGVGAAVFLLLIAIAFLLGSDKPAGALARLRGESITVEPAVTDVGEGQFGAERAFQIQLTNWTDRPVRIVGGTSDCSCVATVSLPVTLAPAESCSIDVLVRFRGQAGSFQRRFDLFTDDDTQRIVVARFVGRVTNEPE